MVPLLDIQHAGKTFYPHKHLAVPAVKDVSFHLNSGEILGIAGESGCGKSTLSRLIMGLYPLTTGKIYYKGKELAPQPESKTLYRDFRKNVQLIFQDSASSLNPKMTIQQIIEEPMRIHSLCNGAREYRRQVDELLELVGLESRYAYAMPNELSGGQRQRISIARAISLNPQIILADEPVASLDISMQAQIINLFQHLQEQQHFSFIFISHDLALLRVISDRIGVMREGHLVELAPTEELFTNPLHHYTRCLLSAIPRPDPHYERHRQVEIYPGLPPQTEFIWREVSAQHFVLV